VEFVNATHRRRPTLWRLLSEAGYRVGVIGLPTTYPPEPVNGFLIAGFDAPVTTGIDSSFVHPPELLDEIRRRVGEFRITDFQELHIGPGWHADALTKLQAALRDRAAIAEYLLTREAWDCFMVLFGESDTVSHHFWMFHDRASPRHDAARAEAYGDAIRTIYRQLDAAVGRLMAAAPEATVILLSDHGFGGTGDAVLYLNRWLATQGYLRFRDGANPFGQALRLGKRLGLRLLPSAWQEQVFRRGGGWLANRLESGARFNGIDWASTRAYSEETNTCPAVWLNVAGREPSGVVSPDTYKALRDEVIAALEAWRNPRTGQRIVRRAWRREELYRGPHVDEAPDVILELALDEGYAYTCQSSGGRPGPALRRLSPGEYAGAKGQSMNGSHRPEGILIMAGEGVRAGRSLNGASLMDVAPTVLALLGLPPPVEMEGRILDEAITSSEQVSWTTPVVDQSLPSARAYTPAEACRVEAQLRSLGYLE
jgi:predicted AlkP superfamily phosphohydrolase/phosphomutase